MYSKNKSFSIARYAVQSFKQYGSISIILMIALAVTLVLSLMNIMTSIQRSMELAAISSGGDAHFKFTDVTPEQIEEVKKLKEVEWAGQYTYLSHLYANVSDKSAELVYIESLGKMDGFKIKNGKSPQKINEVAISPYVAEYLGIEAKVGAEFEVEIIESDLFGVMSDTAVITPTKFVVSGIVQEQEFFKIWESYHIYVSKEFVAANADFQLYDSREVLIKLKKDYYAMAIAPKLAEMIGVDEHKIDYNFSYLAASLNSVQSQVGFAIIIVFFMLVGTLIIYNAFNIIIAKRTRHFGLLTLIGASKKQIKKCVYIEALLNTAVALPIGLLTGTAVCWTVMPFVAGMSQIKYVVYHVSPYSYFLTILVTVLMVAVGAVMPARRAGKISPVEAAKFAPGNMKIGKKIKTKKNITLPSLSRINLFRRKGAGGVTASLSIVGVLFIAMAVVLFSVFDSLGRLVKQSIASDIQIMEGIVTAHGNSMSILYSGEKPMFPENVIERIINLDGVKKSHVFYYTSYKVLNPIAVEKAEMGYILGVDDEIMLEYLSYAESHEGGKNDLASFDPLENPANVLALQYINSSLGINNEHSIGENLTLEIYSLYSIETNQVNLHISAVANRADVPPYVYISSALIMPLSSYKANGFDMRCHTIYLDIDDSKYDSIAAALDKICEEEGNIHYKSFVETKKEYESQLMSIMILIFAGLGIVIVIGILNLISTTFIGIEQRKKELGVLSALGLGKKELRKMLKLEGVWISAFSSVISIIGGCFLSYLFYLWTESFDGANYIILSLPVAPIAIFCLIYIFVPYIISSIAVRKLLKSTMVELIGQEV